MKQNITIKIKSITSACLCADGWTSVNNDHYFAIMLHYIDDNFLSKSFMLNVLCITESTAEDLANALEERFIKTFVTDTTAVMPAMVALLGFTWIPCSAHVLNLVVKYALF